MDSSRSREQRMSVAAHRELIPGEADMEEEWRKEMFGKVRILVVGRSGSGKTTLLRLVIGEEGPQTAAGSGTAGVQNIDHEFKYKSEQGIPLIFHDSNGMSLMEDLNTIKDFLEKSQRKDDYSDHVHVVWYVASVLDERVRDDGGLLKFLSGLNIPMLLVLTHMDVAARVPRIGEKGMRHMHLLIEDSTSVGSEARTTLKESIIGVGNDVEFLGATNRIEIHQLDVEGLQRVSDWTTNAIGSDQMKATWVASQAAYTESKLTLTAQSIVRCAHKAAVSAPAAIIPFGEAIKIWLLFKEVFSTMVTIWGVPKVLQEVLEEKVFQKQCNATLVESAASDLLGVGAAVATVAVTVATAGFSLLVIVPGIVAWLRASTLLNVSKTPIMVTAFALQLVVGIQFVKCRQGRSRHRWDPELTRTQCEALYDDLATNDTLAREIKDFVTSSHSTLDVVFRRENVERILKSRMDRFSNDILMSRLT